MNFFEEFMMRRNTVRLGEEEDTPESMREYLQDLEVTEPGAKIRLEVHPPLPADILSLAAEKLLSTDLDLVVVGKPSPETLDLAFLEQYPNSSSLTVEKDSGQPRGLLLGMLFSFETEEAKEAKNDGTPLAADLTAVASLAKLKTVTLSRLQSDLAPLAACTALETLTLVDCAGIDLAPLAALPQLKSLTIREEQQHTLSVLPGLDRLISLEHLQLAGLDQLATLPALDTLTSLQRIELLELKSLESLSFLSAVPSLEQLVVDKAGKLEPESFRALTGLPLLKRGLITLRRLKLSLAAREILPLDLPKAPDESGDANEAVAEDIVSLDETDPDQGPAGLALPPASAFWEWFVREQGRFVSPGPAPHTPEEASAFMEKLGPIVQEISGELKKAHQGLAVELQLDPDTTGSKEIIISADGQIALFPAVEALCDLAPEIEGWRVLRFRQPKPGLLESNGGVIVMHGISVKMAEALFELGPPDTDGKRPTIIYLPGYRDGLPKQENNAYLGIMFITLDSLLGEKQVGTSVGELDIVPLEERSAEARPMSELGAAFCL